MADGSVALGTVCGSLGLALRAGEERPDAPVTGAIVGDLLSHIMANGRAGMVWVTIQVHPNIIAVAALGNLAAIIIADGIEPDDDTVYRADDEGIPLYASTESAFALSGRLYQLGVR